MAAKKQKKAQGPGVTVGSSQPGERILVMLDGAEAWVQVSWHWDASWTCVRVAPGKHRSIAADVVVLDRKKRRATDILDGEAIDPVIGVMR